MFERFFSNSRATESPSLSPEEYKKATKQLLKMSHPDNFIDPADKARADAVAALFTHLFKLSPEATVSEAFTEGAPIPVTLKLPDGRVVRSTPYQVPSDPQQVVRDFQRLINELADEVPQSSDTPEQLAVATSLNTTSPGMINSGDEFTIPPIPAHVNASSKTPDLPPLTEYAKALASQDGFDEALDAVMHALTMLRRSAWPAATHLPYLESAQSNLATKLAAEIAEASPEAHADYHKTINDLLNKYALTPALAEMLRQKLSNEA
jgi:hypothetical protein